MRRILNIPISLANLVLFLLLYVVALVVSPIAVVIYYPCKFIYKFLCFLSEGPAAMFGFIEELLYAFSDN